MSRRGRQGRSDRGVAEIADRIHSTAIHLLRRLRAEDPATGLSAPRLSALSVVVFAGPITMGDLAAAEQVRPPTISRLVGDLEREGFVRRIPDPDDGRVQRITATARGRRVLEAGRARRVGKLSAELGRLREEDLRILRRAFEILESLVRPGGRRGRRA